MKGRNILIIWDRTGPYHSARAQALRRRTDASVVVAELASSDALYRWSRPIEAEPCRSLSPDPGRSLSPQRGAETPDPCRSLISPTVHCLSPQPVEKADFMRRLWRFARLLWKERIHYVAVAGYAHPTNMGILLISRLLGLRVVLFAESWYARGRLVDGAKGWCLRALCDAVFVSGRRAEAHFKNRLQFPRDRIESGYSVVHNFHFRPRKKKRRGRDFLCVARFVEEKNLMMLMEAFLCARLPCDRRLVLVGDGPLEASLRQGAGGRIDVRRWVQYGALPALYARAEWLVLPSLFEPWGLVVNEAMAAGVPVIASTACGCVPDLLTPRTGFTFDPGRMEALIRVLERAAALSDDDWEQMSSGAMDRVASLTPDSWARALVRAFDLHEEPSRR